MATLLAHIRVREGAEALWESIIEDMVAKTFENETGVLRYEYWKRQKPREYMCLLAFKDKRAFFEHQASDYHLDPPWADVLEDIQLEWVDPVSGASPLPRTTDPELAPDEPENITAWEDRSPVVMAQWWSERS